MSVDVAIHNRQIIGYGFHHNQGEMGKGRQHITTIDFERLTSSVNDKDFWKRQEYTHMTLIVKKRKHLLIEQNPQKVWINLFLVPEF